MADTAQPRTDPHAQQWHDRYLGARAHLDTADNLNGADDGLRRWVDQQIQLLRTGQIDAEHRRLLQALGVTAETPTRSEAILLTELDWWVTEHGDALVPQMAYSREVAGRPYWLGKQVSIARIAHRRGDLSAVLEAELPKRPGWTWNGGDAREGATWERHHGLLTQHVAEHGTLPPLRSATYKWLMRQRAKLGDLPAERARQLAEIPGALVRRDTRVPEFVRAARLWLAEDRERTMSALRYSATVTVDDDTFPLGRRATYYRRRRAGLEGTHPLTDEETALIESLPEWDWALDERYRRRSRTTETTVE